MKAINIAEKFDKFDERWSPRIIAELNGQMVLCAKIKGEFVFHSHENEDEMFQVMKGTLKMAFKDRIEVINEGELIIVPRGVEHKPIADEEVHIMLFEPIGTKHTGEVEHEITKTSYERI